MARRSTGTGGTPRTQQRGVSTAARADTAAGRGESGLSIENHRLVGDGVSYVETPNQGGDLTPQYLVLHYTGGQSWRNSINWLTNPESKASAHLVLGRDGSICQLAPFNVKTWHAGISQWDGLSGLNAYSIGLEMDNAGPLKKVGDRYQAWFGGCTERMRCSMPNISSIKSLAGGMPIRKCKFSGPWKCPDCLSASIT